MPVGCNPEDGMPLVAWMLLYLVAADVYLLDGGLDGWLAANGPLTESAFPRPPGSSP